MPKSIQINTNCIACDSCALFCPENAILTDGLNFVIDEWSCILCGICNEICPVECITTK